MQASPIAIPKIAIRSIAGGLLLMAFFTIMWSGIASGNLNSNGRVIELVVFWGTSLMLMAYSIYFFTMAKRFETILTKADKAKGKKMGMAFGIVFGLEGLFIPIAVFICLQLKQPDLILPAIALVVGLHFFPMAKIFQRNIDYYLATWATVIALMAIVFTLKHTVLPLPVLALLGIGMAVATTSYGFYMIKIGKGYLKS